MGVVYLAKNILMDRLEVLKVVGKELLAQPGASERFLREIRTAAKLSHQHVVTAYSAISIGELLVFAMEYIDGEDLACLVKREGRLQVTSACLYVQQAALGLQHAHENRTVHRDIKPHNLILSRQGNEPVVKILDFGLAKAVRECGTVTELTGAGRMLGTPAYMAPEQTVDAARVDIRSDIYSLGCTLYHLLAGKPPFSGKSLYELLEAQVSQEAESLSAVRDEVPVLLAAVVAKMLAKDPTKRYQEPAEVATALAPFIKLYPPVAGRNTAGQSEGSAVKPLPNWMRAEADVPPADETVNDKHTTAGGRRKRVKGQQSPKFDPPALPHIGYLVGAGVLVLLLCVLVGLCVARVFY